MSLFDFSGPSTTGPSERQKSANRLRDQRLRLQVPDAKGSEPVNAHSPRSIVIGAQSDEGKRGRMRRRAI
jgi:hypothetical protein